MPQTQTTSEVLNPDQIGELRGLLENARRDLTDLYDHDMRAGKEAAQEDSDDIVDRANNAYNRELMFSLSANEREQLVQIEQALNRLDKGTYGFCLHTGVPLPYIRLKAVPWARYSVDVQDQIERGLIEPEELEAIND